MRGYGHEEFSFVYIRRRICPRYDDFLSLVCIFCILVTISYSSLVLVPVPALSGFSSCSNLVIVPGPVLHTLSFSNPDLGYPSVTPSPICPHYNRFSFFMKL